jgi:ribosomal protein S18 acetylase RimI-like enzyme
MELIPASLYPFQTNRLLQELAGYHSDALLWPERIKHVKDLANKLVRGETEGSLWLKEDDTACGLVVWDVVPGAGTRIWDLYLEKEYQSPELLGMLIDDFDTYCQSSGGLFTICDAIAGIPLEEQRSVVQPRGFSHIGRKVKRFDILNSSVPKEQTIPYGDAVAVGPERTDELIQLYTSSYLNRKDLLLSSMPQDAMGSAQISIRGYFSDLIDTGAQMLPWSCIGIDLQGKLIAVILAQEILDIPQRRGSVFDLVVEPFHQKKGFGNYLLSRCIIEAKEHDYTQLDICVTEGNPATRLFERLGFRDVSGADGEAKGLWVKLPVANAIGLNL